MVVDKGKSFTVLVKLLFKTSTRQIIINGDNLNVKADLIKNKVIIVENESMKHFDFSNFKIKDMYLNQHLDILKNKNILHFSKGLNVMKTIEQIKKLNSNV